MLRDEPPSKHCISEQQFCSAAISATSIGVLAAMVGAFLVSREGLDRKSATTFCNQANKTFAHLLKIESQVALLAW
jgi:hypothetical protein